MANLILNGSTSGSVTLSSPAVSGTTTLTLPVQTGTVMVNGPAFSAYMSATQSISNTTVTKIAFNTITTYGFDTNSNYNTATYKFTPTVAGYYQFSARIATASSATGITYIYIAKNTDYNNTGLNSAAGNNASGITISTSGILYMNGTTDYVEAYTYQSTGGSATMGSTSSGYANFQGALVRSA